MGVADRPETWGGVGWLTLLLRDRRLGDGIGLSPRENSKRSGIIALDFIPYKMKKWRNAKLRPGANRVLHDFHRHLSLGAVDPKTMYKFPAEQKLLYGDLR